ncbi:MAG TPA: VOC family protein [Acidimicrobiales bacterium]|nr:VOC family protein [Acidimicrobiales bacterium]
MVHTGEAVPILPVRDLDATMAFYGAVGFTENYRDEGYLILDRGTVQIHFTLAEGTGMAYLRVPDADGFHSQFAAIGGVSRLDPVEDKPWGLREFAVADPSGNLLRVSQFAH